MEYEIIVVGGGHAGCEAALASSKRHKTLLITGKTENIATMPCNPSIGGSAKGIVVREIDALGGYMGKCADKTLLQQKMLNQSKGPAVKSLRCQADKVSYPKEMQKHLFEQQNLTIKEGMVEDLIVENNNVTGVVLSDKTKITSNIVILTTGTYLKSDILVGSTRKSSGPGGQQNSKYLSDNLKKYGFDILRLKTGTPPRIKRDSIDFSKAQIENGDKEIYTFSFDNEVYYDVNNQEPCYLIYTTDETKKVITENIKKSSIYGGRDDITGVGPRYCPSIEDKMVRFSDKPHHQLFLEPESKYYDDIYLQGFSTSMPEDIQEKMVHSLPGLENAEILKYAYAIEYDAIYPTQIEASLETKIIKNLYTAGQINGTSGYEEAACQGLMAGINASLKLENKNPLILKRSDAYIGVLIDDLVTKGTNEPYRLLTSRAEYRLLLRHDNADLRLTEYAYNVGMIDEARYSRYLRKKQEIEEILEILKSNKENNENMLLYVKKPGNTIFNLELLKKYSKEAKEQVETSIKYDGYIKKLKKEVERMLKLEYKKIPEDIDYDKIVNIASEARQKLKKVKPKSLGQAMRISGVNPSDISILSVYMKRYFENE